MGRASRRLLLGAVAIVIVALLLTLGVMAQLDPRNESPEYFDAVNDAQCYEHHLEDGFIPFGFGFVETYSQLPVDEEVTVKVRISHITNYEGPHQVQDMTVTVNTEQAPNVEIITNDTQDPIEDAWGPLLFSHGNSLSDSERAGKDATTMFVGSGAHEGALSARITQLNVGGSPIPVDPDLTGELVLQAGTAESRQELREESDSVEMPFTKDFFESRGRDNYTFDVTWLSPEPLLGEQVTAEIEVDLWVNFTSDATEVTFPSPRPVLATVGDRTEIEIPLKITSQEPALLDFRIRANSFWEHQAGDGAPLDDGIYHRFLTMQVEGGDELVTTQNTGGFAPTPVGEVVNLYNLLTRLLGFIGLFLVVMAMFTGGVFGKASRRWMNKMTGGAKKRVLWHSSMGFLIVVVATVHFALALVETKQDITKGLLWGGLAWSLLISLGFTGYYQVRMIKKWNYRVWRHVHLWSAVAVLLFVLFHTLLDGSDLSAVRELLPSWHEKLYWPTP